MTETTALSMNTSSISPVKSNDSKAMRNTSYIIGMFSLIIFFASLHYDLGSISIAHSTIPCGHLALLGLIPAFHYIKKKFSSDSTVGFITGLGLILGGLVTMMCVNAYTNAGPWRSVLDLSILAIPGGMLAHHCSKKASSHMDVIEHPTSALDQDQLSPRATPYVSYDSEE